MNEDNGKQVVPVAVGSVFANSCGRGHGHGKAEETGKSAEGLASGHDSSVPDPEVSAHPQRRRFSAAYKARIVEKAEACTEPGEVGSLLRGEGLYSSLLSKWREQYRAGALQALRDDKRGRTCGYAPVPACHAAQLEIVSRRAVDKPISVSRGHNDLVAAHHKQCQQRVPSADACGTV
jgi:transposase